MSYIGSPAAPTIATVSDGTVTSNKLADDAVTSAKLDTNIAVDGNLTVDTNTLYVDSTNNRVGISTSSPSTNLHVRGDGSGDFSPYNDVLRVQGNSYTVLHLKATNNQVSMIYDRNGTTGWYSGLDNNGNYKMTYMSAMNGTGLGNAKDTGTPAMCIDSSGKVSLGNTSSDGWLQIKNNNQSDVLITTNDTSGLGGAAMRFKVNNTTVGSISNNTTKKRNPPNPQQ